MKLPNVDRAEVSREKVTGCLLNQHHPDGAGKAAFFTGLGFTVEQWSSLAEALRQLAQSSPVAKRVHSPHGTKYVVDGALTTPAGKTRMVRTVWIVDKAAETARLVTAYPQEEEK